MCDDVDQPGISGQRVHFALIAIGSNAASHDISAQSFVVGAIKSLGELGPIRISRLFQSPAFPPGSGPDFVNAVCTLQTKLRAEPLLQTLHRIEAESGRVRRERWAARVLDLDLLSWDAIVSPSEAVVREWMDLPLDRQRREAPAEMILPHPRIQDRGFVLGPLMDVAPEWCHPLTGLTVAEMWAALPDEARAGLEPIPQP